MRAAAYEQPSPSRPGMVDHLTRERMFNVPTVVVALPPAPDWKGQSAYEAVFGQVPRIVFASIAAFWAGEFANSVVLAKMKVWTEGPADDPSKWPRLICTQNGQVE